MGRLGTLFDPERVAVVGASDEEGSVRRAITENLLADFAGEVVAVRDLAGVTVAELADAMGADVLTSETPTGALVERFTVGAMGPDAALRQFRRLRSAAMITGGDRSEIQTAALQAPGIECLILTGGFRPPGAVLSRAEEAGVPLLSVGTDTRPVVDRAEASVRSGRTRDESTVERTRELLADHADVDALLALDG